MELHLYVNYVMLSHNLYLFVQYNITTSYNNLYESMEHFVKWYDDNVKGQYL